MTAVNADCLAHAWGTPGAPIACPLCRGPAGEYAVAEVTAGAASHAAAVAYDDGRTQEDASLRAWYRVAPAAERDGMLGDVYPPGPREVGGWHAIDELSVLAPHWLHGLP